MQYNWFYQLFYKNTTFTVFVRLLKKQLISRVFVRLLKKVKFYTLQMLRKQNLTHPKASKLATLLLLFAPNEKGEWVDSNFQIIDLLVQPRAAGVAGTLFYVHIANFCYTTTLAACRIFYLPYF